jgi:Ca2+-transporting ATPase
MATFHRHEGRVRVFVKGAPEVVLARSTHVMTEEGGKPLDPATRKAFDAENALLAEQGMRVLAIAMRDLPDPSVEPGDELVEHVSELTLISVVGLTDPARTEAKSAVAQCRRAGIDVKMITGDQPMTARAIARELGLTGTVLTGHELDALDEVALARLLPDVSVIARATPEHKLRLVQAAQASGKIVAVTGDGVNDAPALKRADIGIAMGSGTEVAKEAASMVLTDDNFATIVDAVQQGRTIYDSIVKFIRFQLSTNLGALLSVFAAPFFGLPTPLGTLQILWVAMIMDGPPAIALGLEPGHPGLMDEPPRDPSVRILTARRLASLGFQGLVMMVGTLTIYASAVRRDGERYGTTLAFTTFVLFQVFSVFNSRTERETVFTRHAFTNARLWAAVVVVLALQVAVVHVAPLQRIFVTTALSASDWLRAVSVAASILLVEELRKLIGRHLRGRSPGPADGMTDRAGGPLVAGSKGKP